VSAPLHIKMTITLEGDLNVADFAGIVTQAQTLAAAVAQFDAGMDSVLGKIAALQAQLAGGMSVTQSQLDDLSLTLTTAQDSAADALTKEAGA
jgi:hypothetical protein